MNKIVKIKKCPSFLLFVKAIKEATGKSLLESRNIASSVAKPVVRNGEVHHEYGVLLLNESSITQRQWLSISDFMDSHKIDNLKFEWEYVEP